MVTTFEDEDLPQPWLKRKKTTPPTTRETRIAAKASAWKEKEKKPNALKLPAGGGQGRRKAKPSMVDTIKGKKNQTYAASYCRCDTWTI